jgi:RNA polymerase sigma-70 factor (ECF subfamily)
MNEPSVRAAPSATVEPCPAGEVFGHTDVVEMIRRGHPAGLEELYSMARNFTFFLMRQLGNEDVQDKVHDVFVTVAQAIFSGKLRDSTRLTPFLTTVTRFYTYGQIERRMVRRKYTAALDHTNIPDRRINLEQSVYKHQKMRIVREILYSMPKKDRDVLHRFYVEEQSKEEICREMNLTPTQFRLLKSKAKGSFAKLGRRRLKPAAAA